VFFDDDRSPQQKIEPVEDACNKEEDEDDGGMFNYFKQASVSAPYTSRPDEMQP